MDKIKENIVSIKLMIAKSQEFMKKNDQANSKIYKNMSNSLARNVWKDLTKYASDPFNINDEFHEVMKSINELIDYRQSQYVEEIEIKNHFFY